MLGNGIIILQHGNHKAGLYFGYGLMANTILKPILDFVYNLKDEQRLAEYIEYFTSINIVDADSHLNEHDLQSLFFMNSYQTWNELPAVYMDFPNVAVSQLFEMKLNELPDFADTLNIDDNQSLANIYVIDLEARELRYYVGGESYQCDRDLAFSISFNAMDEDTSDVYSAAMEQIVAFLNAQ